jgi:hypothetical protein
MSKTIDPIEFCARIAEEVAAETGDGEGEVYIARKIADRIRTEGHNMDHRANAIATLSGAGIAIGQEFGSLTPEQLATVTNEARAVYTSKYRGPMTTEFVRKRYDLLQLRASRT